MRTFVAVLAIFAVAGLSAAQQKDSAEMIFINGDIYPGVISTLTKSGPHSISGALAQPRAQAMAVSSGKIVAIGSNQEVQKLKSARTQVIDLGGHFVMPGFNDAHTHLSSGGFEKLDINLVGARSLEEMKRRIAARARTAASGEWLVGRGWDHTLWTSNKLPTRQDIDAETGDHPAIFVRVDGHIAIANTAALKAMGITAQSPDPQGGKIDHDQQGEPTGILRETAKDNVLGQIPKPTAAQRRKAVELALQDAARWGITSAQDNSEWEDFLAYEQLEQEGKLTLRISEWLPFDASVDQLIRMQAHHPANDPLLHTSMLKGFMDGSLGSHTAAMLAPYADDSKNSGIPRYQQDALNKKATERAKAGFQLGFHAIGDRGTRMALDAFALSEQQSGKRDFRFRI